MSESTILHVDMDAFFASVSIRDDPTLVGKEVVVGGGARGVVLSANYAARKHGIRAAMPVARARRMAPQAIFISPSHNRYSEVSKAVMAIFRDFTPLVEPISLDEAFLDVTGAKRLLGSGREIGEKIRQRVANEQGITCSVGIAENKFIAKLASDHCKPNGLLEIPSEGILDFLHPLPVQALWGVGGKTTEQLHRLGLYKVGDIAATPIKTLVSALGESAGLALHDLAWGQDPRRVEVDEPDKSIGAEETFGHDLEDEAEILRELLRVIEKASARMRARNLVCYTISIKVRFADFRTISRAKTTNSPLSAITEIYQLASTLYRGLNLDRARLRLIGISLENLRPADEAPAQLILGEREKGWRDANAALDAATARFGKGAVRLARLVDPD